MWLWRSLSADCYLHSLILLPLKVHRSKNWDKSPKIWNLRFTSPNTGTKKSFTSPNTGTRGSPVQIKQYTDTFCHRVYRVPGFPSSRRNRGSPNPLIRKRVLRRPPPPPPWVQGGRHTRLRLRGRGWGDPSHPIPTKRQTLWNSMYVYYSSSTPTEQEPCAFPISGPERFFGRKGQSEDYIQNIIYTPNTNT
jgi:hypothetical protein